MPKVRNITSVHESTVKKVAENAVVVTKRPRRAPRRKHGPVVATHWYDGVDPLLVSWVRAHKIHYTRVTVVSPTELIIKEK